MLRDHRQRFSETAGTTAAVVPAEVPPSSIRGAASRGGRSDRHTLRPGRLSLADHVQAVLASPAACRRVLRDLRERYDAGMLGDARWSPVAEELQRNRPQPRPTVRWGAR